MTHPRHLLSRFGLSPKQGLGQNFLWDDNILARIAAAANLHATDEVLEIGPGVGALTRHLAPAVARVVAVELDERLLPILERELAPFSNIEVVHGDILAVDPVEWFEGNYKVVANVPYYITGAILRHLTTAHSRPVCMVLTVQKEVAERMAAVPGDMSLLSVSVQFYGDVEVVGEIKAGSFWPRPDVDSAIVRIDLSQAPKLTGPAEEHFFEVVRAGFSQKRKQLQKNLRSLGYTRPIIQEALSQTQIAGRRRAETLSVDEWVRLTEVLRDTAPG